MAVHETEENEKFLIENLKSALKKIGFFSISIEGKWKYISICMSFMFGFIWGLYLYTVFL